MSRRFFVGGNFKMNGNVASISEIVSRLNTASLDPNAEVVISPPSLYLTMVREQLSAKIGVCAQNVFDRDVGAYTGEIAVSQLTDSKITWTLAGHSERRTLLNESDGFVASKVKAAVSGNLKAIFCCGETLAEREADQTVAVVTRQLEAVLAAGIKDDTVWTKQIVVAYEPVWAIGTGNVATTEQAQEVHRAIRNWLREKISPKAAAETRIIYGGSVSEKNCVDLAKQADVDGFLVGGASLKPAFIDIINARRQ